METQTSMQQRGYAFEEFIKRIKVASVYTVDCFSKNTYKVVHNLEMQIEERVVVNAHECYLFEQEEYS